MTAVVYNTSLYRDVILDPPKYRKSQNNRNSTAQHTIIKKEAGVCLRLSNL